MVGFVLKWFRSTLSRQLRKLLWAKRACLVYAHSQKRLMERTNGLCGREQFPHRKSNAKWHSGCEWDIFLPISSSGPWSERGGDDNALEELLGVVQGDHVSGQTPMGKSGTAMCREGVACHKDSSVTDWLCMTNGRPTGISDLFTEHSDSSSTNQSKANISSNHEWLPLLSDRTSRF